MDMDGFVGTPSGNLIPVVLKKDDQLQVLSEKINKGNDKSPRLISYVTY